MRKIGTALVEASKHEEFSARGVVNELFPYIYEASGRMSSRAISRWLAEDGVKLSVTTIAKALRDEKQHWDELFEQMEPAARTVAKARGLSTASILLDEKLYEATDDHPPLLNGISKEQQMEDYEDYRDAVELLRENWFCYSQKVREACLASAGVVEDAAQPIQINEGAK